MRRALFLAMALVAVTAPAAPHGFLDERLAFIGPRDNCRFGELFKLEKPLEPTADTAVAVTMRNSVSGHVIFFWHWDGTTNNVSETPFEDDCCWMRQPSPLTLKAGWNHVKITAPKTYKAWYYGWDVLFMPVLGTSDRPREVPGLEYRSRPPEGAQ